MLLLPAFLQNHVKVKYRPIFQNLSQSPSLSIETKSTTTWPKVMSRHHHQIMYQSLNRKFTRVLSKDAELQQCSTLNRKYACEGPRVPSSGVELQPCSVIYIHIQSYTGIIYSYHIQPSAAIYSCIQPHTAMYRHLYKAISSHAQPHAAIYNHV